MRGICKDQSEVPDQLPVIAEKVSDSQIVVIDKRKFLVPSDITAAQFMWIIRKRIRLPSEKAIFLSVDKTVPQSSLTVGQLYEKGKDEDGFLYVRPTVESTRLASEALAGLGAPFLPVYLVNNWLLSVTLPEPPHRPTSAFVTGFISHYSGRFCFLRSVNYHPSFILSFLFVHCPHYAPGNLSWESQLMKIFHNEGR